MVPTAVWFAVVAALSVKLLDIAELPRIRAANRPAIDLGYFVGILIYAFLGGFIAWAYVASDITLKPIVAVNVGITAPLIIRSMAGKKGPAVIEEPPGA